jgi:hypothetical protein
MIPSGGPSTQDPIWAKKPASRIGFIVSLSVGHLPGLPATRKIKSRTKTRQLRNELPEWYHRGRGVIKERKHGCEKVGHPPTRDSSKRTRLYGTSRRTQEVPFLR